MNLIRRDFRSRHRGLLPGVTAALMAAGLITNPAQAQIQSAGELFVNVDATQLAVGPLQNIPNTGTLGGVFSAVGGPEAVPTIATVGGTKGIQLDGGDFLQHLDSIGGTSVIAPDSLVGEDPTRSIEVWALNPAIGGEETLVSWGRRGGGEGSNMSFNYGSDFRWGAVGHWGNPDLGWNNQGGGPAAGRWHHLVYTFDGATTRVYANGELANAEYLGSGRINTHWGTPIQIGAQMDADGVTTTGGLRFSGTIGRVRVHDGVLSSEQVKNNYDFERAAFIDPELPPPPPPVAAARLSTPPIHRYSFTETASANTEGQEFRDSIGTAHGTVLGEGAEFTGTRLRLPGGPSASAAYGDLPNGLLSSRGAANGGSGEISIETWMRVTGSQTWSRVFDIGSSENSPDGTGEIEGPGGGGAGLDYLALSAQVGGDVGLRRMELRNEDPPGGGIATLDTPTASINTDTHILVTWMESTGQITLYENGTRLGTLTVDDPMSDINDVNVWLGRSNWTGDSNLQGEYDEVRIYDYALTPGQALGNVQGGPNLINDAAAAQPVVIQTQPVSRSVPEVSPVTFTIGAQGSSPVSYQWFRNGTAIPGATSFRYTVPSATGADDGAQYTVQVSNIVGGSPVQVTSAPATLSIIRDAVTLRHRYSFNETSGTQVRDSVGNAHGTLVGSAALGGGELTLDGFGDAYAELPNGIVTGLGQNGTIEAWFTHTGVNVWTRLFDFGVSDQGEGASGAGLDFLFFTPRDGDGVPRFTANFPDGGDVATLVHPGPFPGNQQEHIAISWSASGNVSRLFSNGRLVATGAAPRPLSAMANQDLNNWLGRSQFSADADFTGRYNEFRFYSGAMSPSEVAASFAAGPNNLPTTPPAEPTLSAQVSGNNLIVRWPESATGFQLEGTTSLGGTWTPVSGATVVGGQFQVTVPIEGTARFLRLRQ